MAFQSHRNSLFESWELQTHQFSLLLREERRIESCGRCQCFRLHVYYVASAQPEKIRASVAAANKQQLATLSCLSIIMKTICFETFCRPSVPRRRRKHYFQEKPHSLLIAHSHAHLPLRRMRAHTRTLSPIETTDHLRSFWRVYRHNIDAVHSKLWQRSDPF